MKAMGAAILAALVASLAVAQSPGLYLHVLEVRTEPSLELKHRPLEIVLEASSRSEKWKHGLSELTEGGDAQTPEDEGIPETVGPYAIESKLGGGGMPPGMGGPGGMPDMDY